MRKGWGGLWLLVAAVATCVHPVAAATRKHRHHRPSAAARRSLDAPRNVLFTGTEVPPLGPYRAAILVDAEDGHVLFEKAATLERPPASMVKMMVALLAMEALRAGELRIDQPIRTSLLASRAGGTRVALRPGEVLPLDQMLTAMLVASANDASVAVSEALAGSVPEMLERMNRRARELGMTETVYHTVNGLPPAGRRGVPDITCARDQAILARKLLEYPEILRYSSQHEAAFRNGATLLRNTNHLIGRMQGADGLKTGYIRISGFNLTATAYREGTRLIAVVMGCPTLRCRFDSAEDLLEWGFANTARQKVVPAEAHVEAPVEAPAPTAATAAAFSAPVAAAPSESAASAAESAAAKSVKPKRAIHRHRHRHHAHVIPAVARRSSHPSAPVSD